MEPTSTFFTRFFAISAALHFAVGTIVFAMARDEGVRPTASSALVVSLVGLEHEASSRPLAPDFAPDATSAVAPSPSPARAQGAPIDAPAVESEPTPAFDPASIGVRARVEPRIGEASGAGVTAATTPNPSPFSAGSAVPGDAGRDAVVRAWLEKHKRYPRAAEQRRIEGDVTLDLVLDAAGGVYSSRVVRSSGHRVLDDEVGRMVVRASPFPAASRPDTGVASYRIVVEFHLEEE